MKSAVIFFHKNAPLMYMPEWMEKCKQSIKDQTYQNFDVYELDYGETGTKLFEGIKGKYMFFDVAFPNFIGAMNFMISLLFKHGYDVVFITNLDDYYDPTRFEKQMEKIKEGYQLVSSNFYYVNDKNEISKSMDMVKWGDIGAQLNADHNVIAHPCVAMHRSFWDADLHYENLVGYEDLDLWKRAHNKGKKFFILEDFLLYYRIHDNQITKKHKAP